MNFRPEFTCRAVTHPKKIVSYYTLCLKVWESRTVYRMCSDRVTPCQFLGYEFLNGDYRYFVTESGTLKIYKQGKLLLEESGSWRDQ